MIGKPCARKAHARFDEGELEIGHKPLRQLSTLPIFYIFSLGEITNYTWHVVSGTSTHPGGGAQHQQGHASSRTFSGAKTEGKLVGFFSAEELEGVLSHPGERFHFHYADNDIKTSGHLDGFGVAKRARLLLPKR